MDKRYFKRLSYLFSVLLLFAYKASAETVKEIPIPHEGWDNLWQKMMIDITIMGVIFALVTVYLLIKYRKKGANDVGTAKPMNSLSAFGWVLIPAFVFIADDVYLGLENLKHWLEYRRPPENSYTVSVDAYMWGYEIKYPEGMTTQNELRVPVGKPIRVNLTSRDVIHTLFIPDLKTKWDMLPGKEMFLWFNPDKVGEHVMTCTEFCGMMHSGMFGKVIVMPEQDFAKWVEENKPKPKVQEMMPSAETQAQEQAQPQAQEKTEGGKI